MSNILDTTYAVNERASLLKVLVSSVGEGEAQQLLNRFELAFSKEVTQKCAEVAGSAVRTVFRHAFTVEGEVDSYLPSDEWDDEATEVAQMVSEIKL